MNRRNVLKWISRTLASGCAAMVGVPGLLYALATQRGRKGNGGLVQRVARLAQLSTGRPVRVPVVGTHRDAWTVYPQETLARVWLVRATDESTPAAESRVFAYSSRCPHLGCSVQLAEAGDRFVCPCHRAAFDLSGRRVKPEQPGRENPSPRDLPSLACQLVQDDAGEWWVEVRCPDDGMPVA